LKKESIASVALVCIILGFMLAVQFKTTAANPNNISTARAQDLTEQLEKITKERDALADELASLREKLAQTNKRDQAINALTEELTRANVLAGLVPVKGPGIIVTLTDSSQPLQPTDNPNLYLVHDEDLLRLVNELRAGGAEAIAVNDQRLVSNSEIRCAGPTILVNTTKIAPPFVIKAIGDPQLLESSIRMKGGWLETLETWGIKSQVKVMQTIEIPAYKGPLNFQYAVPQTKS